MSANYSADPGDAEHVPVVHGQTAAADSTPSPAHPIDHLQRTTILLPRFPQYLPLVPNELHGSKYSTQVP
jgi:hypothetical protein